MRTILIDLNIILDYLFNREGHNEASKIIVSCIVGEAKGYMCAHEITTLSYFLNKKIKNKDDIINTISKFMQIFEIIEINRIILERALISGIMDYEDAVVVESAKELKIDYIITRNISDFKNSQITALTPEEYLASVHNKNK